MGQVLLKFIFFGNYFIGILAIFLTIESNMQLNLMISSFCYYVLIFILPILYYTYAYMNISTNADISSPRILWYAKYIHWIRISQSVLATILLISFTYLVFSNFDGIKELPLSYWIGITLIGTIALLYYGMIPIFTFKINLRNSGLIKPFVIGFVWAALVNFLPILMIKIESGSDVTRTSFWFFLFIKNWMFCTVNAIMFDMKDYAVDYSNQLKTFVVRLGIRKTIYQIIIPLLSVGAISLIIFATLRNFLIGKTLVNLLPFVITIFVACSMSERKGILYYLIVIDGLILIKALCGIIAIMLFKG